MSDHVSLYQGQADTAVRPVAIAAAVGLAIFLVVVFLVTNDMTRSFDERFMLALRTDDPSDPIGPAWFEETAGDLTALGGYPLLVPIVAMVAVALVLLKHRQAAIFLVVAIGSGSIVSSLLKELFARPRPDLVEQADRVFTSSFPSAHAMVSAVAWLTLAAVTARFVPRRALRRFVVAMAILITLTVGVSRVYLGVHWPTDIVAGWGVGFAWAGICWLVAHRMEHGDEMETDLGTSKA